MADIPEPLWSESGPVKNVEDARPLACCQSKSVVFKLWYPHQFFRVSKLQSPGTTGFGVGVVVDWVVGIVAAPTTKTVIMKLTFTVTRHYKCLHGTFLKHTETKLFNINLNKILVTWTLSLRNDDFIQSYNCVLYWERFLLLNLKIDL